MAKALTLPQAARVGAWFILSVALLFAGPRLAENWIFDPTASVSRRYAGVAISILSVVPWLVYVAWGISVADEFNRRTMILGTALGLAIALLFSMTAQLLADAHLIDHVITIDLGIGFLIWFSGMGAVFLYERVRAAR